jgi:hypothetical protein
MSLPTELDRPRDAGRRLTTISPATECQLTRIIADSTIQEESN